MLKDIRSLIRLLITITDWSTGHSDLSKVVANIGFLKSTFENTSADFDKEVDEIWFELERIVSIARVRQEEGASMSLSDDETHQVRSNLLSLRRLVEVQTLQLAERAEYAN